MKNLKVFIYLFIATGLVLVSCSKDSNKELEASVNESTQLITATDAKQAPDLAKLEAELLNFNKTAAFKESAKNETATSRNALPSRVQTTITREYPNASMLSYEERPIRPNSAYKHYAVFLDNGMEVVVFQWGHLLANATIEKEYESTELQAGELDWDIMLRLHYHYTTNGDVIEEIEPSSQANLFDIDFKDGRRIVVNTGGQVVATGQDTDGDDDDGIGLPTLPGGDDNSTSGNGDDDDDGLGDNDDGVSGNQDDDDDGDGDNDDGVSSNNDDDDDGDGDNDDGINGNSDDDDDGNGDNDDGASGNSNHINPASLPASIRNYIAANYPNATIIEAEQYSNRYEVELNNGVELYFDLNGNLINTSGNDNDDDDDNGTGSSSDNDDDDDNGTGSSSDNDDDDDNGTGSSSDNDDDDDNGTGSSSDNDDDDD